jgi:hypothetical protein
MQTLILRIDNEAQADILIKLAKELHIKIDVIDSEIEAEKKSMLTIANSSFAKDWNSKEDEHWDEFLKK